MLSLCWSENGLRIVHHSHYIPLHRSSCTPASFWVGKNTLSLILFEFTYLATRVEWSGDIFSSDVWCRQEQASSISGYSPCSSNCIYLASVCHHWIHVWYVSDCLSIWIHGIAAEYLLRYMMVSNYIFWACPEGCLSAFSLTWAQACLNDNPDVTHYNTTDKLVCTCFAYLSCTQHNAIEVQEVKAA